MNFNRKVIECGAVASLVVALSLNTNVPQTMPTVAFDVTETKTVAQEILLSPIFSSNIIEMKANTASAASDEGDNESERKSSVETAATETAQDDSDENNQETDSQSTGTKIGVLAHLESGSNSNTEETSEKNDSKEQDSSEKKEKEEVSPWDNKVMAKVEDYTNIRASQDSESELVGKLYRGSAGDILEAGDEWTKIKSGSVEGYVKNEYLTFGKDAEALANEQCELEATVQTTTLNIRKEPSEDAEIVALAAEGETLSVAEQNDEWLTINYNDTTAYIAAEYASVEQKVGQAISIEEEQAIERQKAEEEKARQEEERASQAEEAKNSTEVAMLAAIIQCEAGSESYEGKLAVGAVVMNRVRSGAYPGSVEGVITQAGQFSPVASGAYGSVLSRGASGECYSAAVEAYMGSSNVGGALSFRGASSGIGGTVIGNHVFF